MRKVVKLVGAVLAVVLVLYWLARVPQGWGAVIVWSFMVYVVVRAWPNVKRDCRRLRPNSLRGRHGGMFVGSRGGDSL